MKKSLFFLLFFVTCGLSANPTVVGLHGFMQDSRTMRSIQRELERACFDVYLWDYPSRRYTIECHATHLITELQNIARCKPGEPIHFVAHSVGALIVRAALNLPGCPEEAKIGKVILLAPPNQGVQLAREFYNTPPVSTILGNAAGLEIMTLTACDIPRCFGEFPEGMPVLVIAGSRGVYTWFSEPNDGYIAVSETYLNTKHQHVILGINHGALLTNAQSLCLMRQFLCAPMPSLECERIETSPSENL